MAKRGKKSARVKYKNLIISRTKRYFLVKQKAFLISKLKIVNTNFNCHSKISFIKNLMHTYFLPEIHYQNLSH